MCVEHAYLIDDENAVSSYPVELLRQWKKNQLEQYNRIRQGWILDSDMANQAIEASESRADVVIEDSTIELGGEGGKAPGAGGGGGGAIGKGARGGRGGDGGGHRIEGGDYTLTLSKADLPPLQLMKTACQPTEVVPGTGGGGRGTIGNDARAGDGGGGGERVSTRVDIAALRKDGFSGFVRFTNGAPGGPGCDGGDSVLEFMAKDGRILKTIRASGGKGGASSLPEGVAEISVEDVRDNFRITTLMVANAVDMRDGLLFLLGADWINYSVPSIPCDVGWSAICSARWEPASWPGPRGFFLSVLRPNGSEAFRNTMTIPSNLGAGGAAKWVIHVGLKLDVQGTWILKLHAANIVLARVEVKVAISPPS